MPPLIWHYEIKFPMYGNFIEEKQSDEPMVI